MVSPVAPGDCLAKATDDNGASEIVTETEINRTEASLDILLRGIRMFGLLPKSLRAGAPHAALRSAAPSAGRPAFPRFIPTPPSPGSQRRADRA